jgi:hypothetical protein
LVVVVLAEMRHYFFPFFGWPRLNEFCL